MAATITRRLSPISLPHFTPPYVTGLALFAGPIASLFRAIAATLTWGLFTPTCSSRAHPKIGPEVLAEHSGKEFTVKMRAYTQSAQLADDLIIESSTQAVHRYSWKLDTHGVRRLMWRHQRRGPVSVPSLGRTLTFEQIYEKTNVPVALHQVTEDDETEIVD